MNRALLISLLVLNIISIKSGEDSGVEFLADPIRMSKEQEMQELFGNFIKKGSHLFVPQFQIEPQETVLNSELLLPGRYVISGPYLQENAGVVSSVVAISKNGQDLQNSWKINLSRVSVQWVDQSEDIGYFPYSLFLNVTNTIRNLNSVEFNLLLSMSRELNISKIDRDAVCKLLYCGLLHSNSLPCGNYIFYVLPLFKSFINTFYTEFRSTDYKTDQQSLSVLSDEIYQEVTIVDCQEKDHEKNPATLRLAKPASKKSMVKSELFIFSDPQDRAVWGYIEDDSTPWPVKRDFLAQ